MVRVIATGDLGVDLYEAYDTRADGIPAGLEDTVAQATAAITNSITPGKKARTKGTTKRKLVEVEQVEYPQLPAVNLADHVKAKANKARR